MGLSGSPITVNPGQTATQIPVTEAGGTIVNDGTVPIQLSSVDPPQGATFTLSPSASVPFSEGTVYAYVNGTIPGTCYLLSGVQVLSSGETGIGGVGLSSEGGILSIPPQILAAGATGQYDLGINGVIVAARLATWGYASTGALPTSGNVQAQFGSSNNAQVNPYGIFDIIPISENMSDKLQGLYIPAVAANTTPMVQVTNFTNVPIEFLMNWWPA